MDSNRQPATLGRKATSHWFKGQGVCYLLNQQSHRISRCGFDTFLRPAH